jgi:hypothetical protein
VVESVSFLIGGLALSETRIGLETNQVKQRNPKHNEHAAGDISTYRYAKTKHGRFTVLGGLNDDGI